MRSGRGTTGSALAVALVLGLSGCGSDGSPASPTSGISPTPATPSLNVPTVFIAAPPAAPSSATDALVGRYKLEIEARSPFGSTCSLVPESARHRTYTADVVDLGGRYAVRLYEGTFLTDSVTIGYACADPRLPEVQPSACHQFLITGNASSTLSLTLSTEDEGRGSEIWEALPEGLLLAINGHASGRASGGRIEASGSGVLWLGDGLPASRPRVCQSDDLRFTFTPR